MTNEEKLKEELSLAAFSFLGEVDNFQTYTGIFENKEMQLLFENLIAAYFRWKNYREESADKQELNDTLGSAFFSLMDCAEWPESGRDFVKALSAAQGTQEAFEDLIKAYRDWKNKRA